MVRIMSDKLMTQYPIPENTPEKAPLLAFDTQAANYFDLFAPQYYNLDTVQALAAVAVNSFDPEPMRKDVVFGATGIPALISVRP